MSRIYEFVVDEIYLVRCRYQVAADSEADARRKAANGDTVQDEVDGREELRGRNVVDLLAVFDD
jgi:hypothetical protein